MPQSLLISGPGVYVVAAATFANPITVTGNFHLQSFTLTAQSSFALQGSGAHLSVQNAAAALTVNGNASFDGGTYFFNTALRSLSNTGHTRSG